MQKCYNCGKEVDDNVLICPDCGTRQALQSIGVDSAEQEQIIETIHRHTQG